MDPSASDLLATGPNQWYAPNDTAQPTSVPGPDLCKRVRKAPSHLQDYICYTVKTKGPSPITLTPQKVSSGEPYPIANFITCNKFSDTHQCYLSAITKIVEPKFYHEAVRGEKWREEMAKEIEALEQNNTWTLVDLPPGRKPISCKWVYKVKYQADGSIERCKARLVIRGDKQVEGFDFTETLAPAAKMTSVGCFLAVAAARRWEMHQTNVNNAFLHGDMEEDVSVTLLPGFKTSNPNKVCKL